MRTERQFQLPRIWSNRQLRKISHLFSGKVVNISAWNDCDKEGGCYKDYFKNAESYYITNYSGYRGFQNRSDEIFLDLSKPLPEELVEKFDVVFNHTTLEHIVDFNFAFKNICRMSRDIVITVVPFAQTHHPTEEWGDYWRFTPEGLEQLFKANGLATIYRAANNDFNCGIYLFAAASKFPDKWMKKMPQQEIIEPVGEVIGQNRLKRILSKILRGQKKNDR
jgi:hypothetical protein